MASIFSGLFTAATAVPKLGMAGLMVAGGALNIAGSALASANLVATAALMASGGLHGRRSGNAKKDEAKQRQMVESSVNKKGPTGRGESRGGASNSLANVKSTLADYKEPEGSMSMLPTGDEDGMGMLSGMLRQIAVNTSYLGGIDSKINALVGLSSMPLIDQAQETKGGEGSEGAGRDGIIRRSFNSLSNGIGRITGSLGGAIKNVVKGLALFAAFITFKKFEPEITSGLASLFKNISGFFDTMSAGADPSEGILGYFDNMMETSILPTLTIMAEKALDVIFKGITIALNRFLPGFLKIDEGLENASSGASGEQTQSQVATQKIVDAGGDLGKVTGYGDVAGKNIGLGNQFGLGGDGDVKPGLEAENVKQAVRDRLQFMYNVFMKSGGRVRWTEIGKGFSYNGGIDSLNGTFEVSDILFESKPIIDGFVKERRKDGKYIENLPKPNLTGSNLTDYIRSSIDMSKAKQVMEDDPGFLNSFLFQGPSIGEKFLFLDENMGDKEAIKLFNDSLKKRNLILNDDGASLGNKGNGDVAMIDSSTTVHPYNDNRISGLTSAINSNIDLVTLFGNNQAV